MLTISRFARPILAALPLAVALSLPAAAQPQPGQTHGDWTVACQPVPEGQLCFIEQVVSNESNGIYTAVAVARTPEENQILVRVPLGVILTEGLGLQVDEGEPAGLPYQQCTPQGCQVVAPLSDDGVARLKGGKTLNVMFIVPSGEVATAPISLRGFTAGYDSLAPR